ARELLLGLAEEALSGRGGDVVCLEAPEWPPLPALLRRELDGRSVYTRPGTARYATAAQLSAEERLVAHAQARRAPRLPGELAARRLGVDAELVAAQLRERGQDAHQQAARGGLRLGRAGAVWRVLTSARTGGAGWLEAGAGRGSGAARRRGRRRRDDAACGPARVRAAGRAGPVRRRLGTRGLATAAPRGPHRAGRI